MKKLIIQIPCFNEAVTLGVTLSALPRSLPDIEKVEWLVVNDGSTDDTIKVAEQHGVDHIVSLKKNCGLGAAFMAGVHACLERGADIIVNTDADNQYDAADIAALISPIAAQRADIVIGARPINSIANFSLVKKLLQKVGSWVVRKASGTEVSDAASGFRALSRVAAQRMHIYSSYTYTLEMIIAAGQQGLAVESVPVHTNPPLRPSRLIRSTTVYVLRSAFSIFRIFITYRPLWFFMWLSAFVLAPGLGLALRYLAFMASGSGTGHVQSVVAAAMLISIAVMIFVIGIVADLVAVNRKLLERIDLQLKERAGGHYPGSR